MAGTDTVGEKGGRGTEGVGCPSDRIHQRSTSGVQRAMPYSSSAGSDRPGSKSLSAFSMAAISAGVTSGRAQPRAESTISRR
ncbi:hypothetical protein ACFY2M_01395 [Streptomyces sp. NPDC001276]|uniref:hypothetical protein n=1 Tax=Streptomyces sp. NPDC001276 TaxID=3364555 RepID=UPI0036C30A53